MTTPTIDRTAALEERLDALASDVAYIAAELREQATRRQAWDELRTDLAPIATDAMSLASRELEDMDDMPSAEDVTALTKRLVRNTRNIEATVQRFESTLELLDDLTPITSQAVMKATTTLEDLEKRGYFGFASSSLGVFDRVVTSFSEEDVDQLGENIVLILQTVKEMTQPEVMQLLQRTAAVLDEEVASPSTFALLRQMRDPEVKRGLARMLQVLRSFSDTNPQQPLSTNQSEENPQWPN